MADISASVAKLSLGTGTKSEGKRSRTAKKPAPVADSWEDEDVSSGSEAEDASEDAAEGSLGKGGLKPGTAAPPPTPISPNYAGRPMSPMGASVPAGAMYGAYDGPQAEKARPEKTDAVARRMIASALGVKVPKQTEEQRAYDKAMREKERKRREEQKGEERKKEEEAAKAKAAVWDD